MVNQLVLGLGVVGLTWFIADRIAKSRPRAAVLSRNQKVTVNRSDEISIVSYNVLADNLVAENAAYDYANPLYMSWEYRWCLLQEEFKTFDADLVCLQEVEIARWDEFNRTMDALGYTGVLQNRKKNSKLTIACAIFFKTDKFRIGWEEHRSRAMALALHYEDSEGQEQVIYVVNLHLEGDPKKPGERVAQLNSILQRLEAQQGAMAEQCDVVICGDFNCTRWNSPWQYLWRGRLEQGYTEAYLPNVPVVTKTVAHPYALQDTYLSANMLPHFTTRAPRRRSEVDFIWCSRHMKVLGVMKPLDAKHSVMVERWKLPNKVYPSDHLPIAAVISRADPPNESA